MNDKPTTAQRFGFFTRSTHEADVAETAVAQGNETAHTNALAQCIALETRDESGKRTLTHISPFDDDNPMHTEDQQQVARYWTERIMAEHAGAKQVEAVMAGGRKGHALSEQLHNALQDICSELKIGLRDESNMAPGKESSNAITNVRSDSEGLHLRRYEEGRISSRSVER